MTLDEADDRLVVGGPDVSIELRRPQQTTDGSGVRIPIRLTAPGVEAQATIELYSWSGGTKSLTGYFDELSTAWRGWSGPREWFDDGPNIWLTATHDAVGMVTLEVRADPFAGWDGSGSWIVVVRVPIEPGSLDTIARRLTTLLNT